MELNQFEEVLFPRFINNPEQQLNALKDMTYREGDVLLCVYPSSGNHWHESMVRALLRLDDKENVSSRSSVIDLHPPDFIRNMESPMGIPYIPLSKPVPYEHVKNRAKMVLILRNQKDILVASYHHFTRYVVIQNRLCWDRGFDTLKRLAEHIGVTKTTKELETIVAEFSLESFKAKIDPGTIPPALKDAKNQHVIYRKGVIGDWKNHFTVAQNEQFNEVLKQVKFS